jgi:hypothetical protein
VDSFPLSQQPTMRLNEAQTSILSLRANVSESEAIRSFAAGGLSAFFWRIGKGKFQRIAPAYVPFRLYRVSYEMNGKVHARYFALDQVQGILDLFEFSAVPEPNQLARIESRNQIQPAISEEQSELLLREKVLRLIFQQGFFRLRQPNLQIELSHLRFNIPYWLGFYGEDGRVRCRVLDAVRRRMEGQKATVLFEHWLAS